jgi:hypothetical protein
MGGKSSKAGGKAGQAALAASGKNVFPPKRAGGSESSGTRIARSDSGGPSSGAAGYSKVNADFAFGRQHGKGPADGEVSASRRRVSESDQLVALSDQGTTLGGGRARGARG